MKFDISKNFYVSNGDISKISEANTFLENLKNILSTEPGDNIFTKIGCGLKQYQFTQIDTFNARLLLKEIERSIYKFNPNVEEAVVKVSPKTKHDAFNVEIWVKLKKVDDIITFQKLLKE